MIRSPDDQQERNIGDITPVPPGAPLNAQPLIDRLAPGARVTDCRALTGGVSAEVHAVTFVRADGTPARAVVRRHRSLAGKADPGARAAREYALLRALRGRGLPVPGARLFEPPDTLVIDFVDGDSQLPFASAEALAAVLAAIHATPLDDLPELPLREDPWPDLLAWLPALAKHDPAVGAPGSFEGPPRLLHGDFWPGNVLWRAGEIAAVIDWEDAALGDPLSDLACARVELACAAGEAVAQAFTAAYLALSNLPDRRLPLWDLYVSTAALQYMDQWGLDPAALADRKATTQRWQARALAVLGWQD